MARNMLNDGACYERQIITLGGDLLTKLRGGYAFQRDPKSGEPDFKIEVSIDDLCRRIAVTNDLRQMARR